jgi:hypothetical protein
VAEERISRANALRQRQAGLNHAWWSPALLTLTRSPTAARLV